MSVFIRSIIAGFLFAGAAAHAADPANDALKQAIGSLMSTVAIADQTQRVQGLCQLADQAVDVTTIAPQLLGSFAGFSPDQTGIDAFTKLVPSLIVTDFYSLVADKAGASWSVDTTPIPKGSTKVAYRVNIAGNSLTVTMSKKTNKVADVEFFGISLIKTKADQYQSELQSKSSSSPKPVTDLVNELLGNGKLIRCIGA